MIKETCPRYYVRMMISHEDVHLTRDEWFLFWHMDRWIRKACRNTLEPPIAYELRDVYESPLGFTVTFEVWEVK